jgi:hypothetical protein
MPPNQLLTSYNDSTSSIDPLADSNEFAPMTSPSKVTQRATLKPASDRQSLKFHDLVLATPTRPPSRKGRSSPPKPTSQAESPWRIRVTVEAEREDARDGEQGLSRSTTTKVPLKGEITADSAAKKGRGRLTKSGGSAPVARKRSATPTRKKASRTKSRSAANGTEGETDTENEDSVRRKRVGRPRKSISEIQETPQPAFLELVKNDSAMQESRISGCRAQHDKPSRPTFQISVDQGDDEPGIHANNELPESQPHPGRAPLTITAINRQPAARLPQDPPLIAKSISTKVRTAEEEEARFTPVKRTPTKHPKDEREKDVVARRMNAGHTPRRSSVLPTPSSSPKEAETLLEPPTTTAAACQDNVLMNSHQQADPEPPSPYREFDTIMEGEGFSMVSLESVPSAKQHLSSPVTSRESSASKAVSLQGQTSKARVIQVASVQLELPSSPPAHTYADVSSLREETPSLMESTPKLPPLRPPQPAIAKKSTPKLARVVRAGIALQGVLDSRKKSAALGSPFSSSENTRSGPPQSPKERLDNLFCGFGPETQRELRAGLRLGEELARRRREVDEQKKALQMMGPHDSGDAALYYPSLPSPNTQQQLPSPVRTEHNYDEMSWKYDTPGTRRMKEREFEWQREREAVSHQIQEANASQVIVIDSDDPTPSHLYQEEDQEHTACDLQQLLQNDASQFEEDIWQQEAFSLDPQQDSDLEIVVAVELPKPRRTKIPSPWRRGEDAPSTDDATDEFSGVFDLGGGSTMIPPKRWAERKKPLEPLDFSALLNPKDGRGDPSGLFKADETLSSPGRSHVIEEGTSSSLTPLQHEDNRRSDLEIEDISGSDEKEADSTSISQWVVAKPSQRVPQDRLEVPQATHAQDIKMLKAMDRVPTILEKKPPHEKGQSRKLELAKEKKPTEHTDRALKRGTNEGIPSAATNRQSWFGMVTSYLPSWRTSVPANAPDSASFSTFSYRKASFTNLPPHGLPHPATPLPTHGPWTNAHYKYLLLLHNHSVVHPEDFPLAPSADRSLLGEIMEADGHTRPVSELQLGIVETWKATISKGNKMMGWSGELEWDDPYILKGLFSVEVGQVNRREARRIKLLEEQQKERKGLSR